MTEEDGAQRTAAARLKGQAFLDQVIVKATEGKDPFQLEPPKPRGVPSTDAAAASGSSLEDPDVVAFGRFFERHRVHLVVLLFLAAQACSWVLMKGSLIAMHTPAVLTFLHMLAAGALHLVAVAYHLLPPPQLSSVTLKGAAVHVPLATLQLLLPMAALLHGSVYMLLCTLVLAPLLSQQLLQLLLQRRPTPPQLVAPLALAGAAAGLEILLDSHRGLGPLLLLLLYACVVVAGHCWGLLAGDATLGGRLSDPEVLFRIREVSDAEELTPPATAALLQHALPAAPVLLLGLLAQEGRDLVEHEPSVPALSVMLLSCLAHGVACMARVVLVQEGADKATLQLLTGCAALVAILLDFLERAHTQGPICLAGVTCCVLCTLWCQVVAWSPTGHQGGGVLPSLVQHQLRRLQGPLGATAVKVSVT